MIPRENDDVVGDNSVAPTTAANLDPQANDGHVKSPEERRFLRKLDLCLLTFGCISQVIKYLDQQNINFAYTSGMKEDLHLYGNELNYFLTYFNIGYCIFLIPSQVMITRFRPAIWLSSLEFFWGVLTMSLAGTKNATQVYIIRVFIGAAESSAYPGTVSLLMTWYTPLEMAKRIGFYHSCQAMGSMLAGALQAAILKSLDGQHGLAGWRWTFIINGIITLAIACMGLFMIPDFPDRPNKLAFWFKPHDKVIAEARLERWRRKSPNAINFRTAKKVALNPMTYHLAYIYIGMLIASYGSNYLNLFLQSLVNPDGTKVWTREALSAVPIGGYAMQIFGVWLFALSSDFLKTRWSLLFTICMIGVPSTVILTVWNVPLGAKYYAYFALFLTNSSGPLIWSWMSDMLPRDAEQRTLIIGVCISLYYAINAWANVLIYPASEAPHYRVGWAVALAIWITTAMVIVSLRIYDIKVVRPRNHREKLAAEQEYDAALRTINQQQEEEEAKLGGEDKGNDNVYVAHR